MIQHDRVRHIIAERRKIMEGPNYLLRAWVKLDKLRVIWPGVAIADHVMAVGKHL